MFMIPRNYIKGIVQIYVLTENDLRWWTFMDMKYVAVYQENKKILGK